jgi:predicted acetyltransferase
MTHSAPAAAAGTSPAPYPIRPVAEDEFELFHHVDQHAFHGAPLSAPHREISTSKLEFDRTLAAVDGTQLVGTAAAYSFRLSVPGPDMLPAAGVTWVSVLPTHRRRGVVTALMRRQLADVAARGEPLAVLWASESAIYSRFGYGRASWYLAFTLQRFEGQLTAAASLGAEGVRLRITEPGDALAELAKIYDTVLPSRPGFFARNDAWWRSVIFDPADDRDGQAPLRCLIAEDDSGPRGYALYAGRDNWDDFLPQNVLTVRELIAADAAASAALYGNLLSRDLTTEFRMSGRPVDDPLLYQLADPRRSRPRLNDSLWVRIVDLPRALAGRSYAVPVDLVLEVRDDIATANAGRWRLRSAGEEGDAVCEPATGPADLALDITQLGAAYLGGTRIGALAEAGLVTELRPSAVRRLSAAMAWDPAPWCPVVF